MIQIHLLGAADFRCPQDPGSSPVVSQARRLALLAFLALKEPGKQLRRETVLPYFWPEADDEHARGALRNALHYLRRVLGSDVILSRTADEVGLAWDRIWCDVVAFRRAVEEGRVEEACRLYRGPLLDGFFIKGAPQFEEWLESERRDLERIAVGTAWKAAQAAIAAGSTVDAARYAHQTLALCRADESIVRSVLRLLNGIGNRSQAVLAYEQFAHRLAMTYDLEPSPETRTLAAALRCERGRGSVESGNGPPPTATHLEAAEPGTPPRPARTPAATVEMRAVPSRPIGGSTRRPAKPAKSSATSSVDRSPTASRRKRLFPLGAAVSLAITATLAWAAARRPVAPTPTSGSTVAVFPFVYRGDADYAYLGDGMVELLDSELHGAGDLRLVDPLAILSRAGSEASGVQDLSRVRALAHNLGAGLFIIGSIVENRGGLQVTARLYETGTPEPLVQADAEGKIGDLFDLTGRVAARLVGGRSSAPSAALTSGAALSSRSFPALRAFLEGERAFRLGDAPAAVDAFQRAVELDTSFALAYYRLGIAAEWSKRPELASRATAEAARRSERLPPRERLLLEAGRAWHEGKAADALELYTALLDDDPTSVEGWFQLGEVLYHSARQRGHPRAEARHAFERAAELDSRLPEVSAHLAVIAADEGRWADFDTLAEHIARRSPATIMALEFQVVRAFAGEDAAERRRMLQRLAQSGEKQVRQSATAVFGLLHDPLHTRAVASLLTAESRAPQTRALGHIWLAELDIAGGQWEKAQAHYALAAPLAPAATLESKALAFVLPFANRPVAEMRALRDTLLAWRADSVPPSRIRELAYSVHDDLHPYLRRYLLGLLEARIGDYGAALAWSDSLTATADADFLPATALAAGVHADVLRHEGRSYAALRELEALSPSIWYQLSNSSPFLSLARERFVRAELLSDVGRTKEALQWYSTFSAGMPSLSPYVPVADDRAAALLDQLGERARAAEHRSRARSFGIRAVEAGTVPTAPAGPRRRELEPPARSRAGAAGMR